MKEEENLNNAETQVLNIPVVKHRFTCNKCRASEFHNECSLGSNPASLTTKL